MSRRGTERAVRIVREGSSPEDGFSCYPALNDGEPSTCRWGDYSASFALPGGEVWSATEIIGDRRTEFANWGTFVWPSAP